MSPPPSLMCTNSTRATILSLILFAASAGVALGKERLLLAEDGQPQAEIVVAENPKRMARLAAQELQSYIEKISGAVLEIRNEPSGTADTIIYIGESPYTDDLAITDEGLHHGAYRMQSGDGWLVLLGRDRDFTPPEPWARNRSDIDRMNEEWDKITGSTWDNPIGVSLHRQYNRSLDLWDQDQGGSLNATYALLRELGVRWYMPGELGEIVPRQTTIALAPLNREVQPDYASRFIQYFGQASAADEDVLWYMRLGLNHAEETLGAAQSQSHGLRNVHGRDEMKQAHPEYFALYNGVRDTDSMKKGKPCLSSPGLFDETVRYARTLFDVFDLPMVSVGPQDGYVQLCQCELCVGKSTPERGYDGEFSDYVWDFVDRVAREVYKTHPDKLIACGAYGKYTLPPTAIERLSPNVSVHLVHARGKHFDDPEIRREKMEIINAWQQKTDNKVLSKEHYVFTHRGTYLPVYFPTAISEGLAALRDHCFGEHVEVAWGPAAVRGHGLHEPGFNHLNIYLTSQLYWDSQQNATALLDEYYQLFYGPAAQQMKAFVGYSEENWEALGSNPSDRDKAELIHRIDELFDLIGSAQQAAGDDSVYRKRIDLIADYLSPLRNRREQLAQPRDSTLSIRLPLERSSELKLDGQLDEAPWQNARKYKLRHMADGSLPAAETTVQMFWQGDRLNGALWIGIHCSLPEGEAVRREAQGSDSQNIWADDHIEVLLETQVHAYYQMVVSASAALTDLDRANRALNWDWQSLSEVATHSGDGYWSVEMRIPCTGTDSTGDPLNEIVGRTPTQTYPWYINIGANRPQGGPVNLLVLTPNDEANFHSTRNFATIYIR